MEVHGKGARLALLIFFLGLLATPFVMKKYAEGHSTKVSGMAPSEALLRFGFFMEEVSRDRGIRFEHRAPELDQRLAHIEPQVASLGAAVSVVDYNRDGFQDLYVISSAQGSRNALYRNDGTGNFADVARDVDLAYLNTSEAGFSMGAVWGDYDNDGFEDAFIYRWGRPDLYRNVEGKRFERLTGTGLPAWANVNAAIWVDFDRDGLLDLFFAGYYDERLDLRRLKTTRMMPESFEYANNGGRKYLYRNLGDGRFQDVTTEKGLTSRRWTLAIGAADLTGSGFPDLLVANDYGISELFINQQAESFRSVGEVSGIGAAPKSGMNVAFGDVFNDGRLAAYISNISEDGILLQGNNLWVPRAGSRKPAFDNMAHALGVELGGWSYGAQFGDLNNDGFTDLFLTNGHISADKRNSYWYDYSRIAGGNETIIGDARHWPEMKGRSLGGYQQKKVWINDGAGHFSDVAPMVGVKEVLDGRAVALVDLENRGVLDVVVAHHRGPVLVYRNTVDSTRSWIDLSLEGTVSNRSAIGARVQVRWKGGLQVQEVHGGIGFAAQNQRKLHFGLGSNPGPVQVSIRWPDGHVQELKNLSPGRLHVIKESA